jgi:tetratricopeptide (TPR) repeat protein
MDLYEIARPHNPGKVSVPLINHDERKGDHWRTLGMSKQIEAAEAWDEYVRTSGMPKCAFSTRKVIKIGTGTTTQKKESKILWVGKQIGDDLFEVQRVNSHLAPSGDVTVFSSSQFFKDFHPEVDIFNTKIMPVLRKIQTAVERGDSHRQRREPYSAEFEYNIALDLDEKCVRALFGLGLVYLARNETDKARVVFTELVDIKAAFAPEHKHLFNEFGIQMRKKGMFDEALAYFQRGLEFDSTDENLYFNLARASFEKGDYQACVSNLAASLDLNASAEEAREFARYLVIHVEKIMQEAQLDRSELAAPLLKAVSEIGKVVERPVQSQKQERSRSHGDKLLHYDRRTGHVDVIN